MHILAGLFFLGTHAHEGYSSQSICYHSSGGSRISSGGGGGGGGGTVVCKFLVAMPTFR